MNLVRMNTRSLRWPMILLLLLTSVLINGLQGRRILKLEAVLEGRTSRLEEGQGAPPLQLADIGGKRVTINYRSSSGTLIYVFSPSCVWCKRNGANFRALSRALGGVHVIALSLSSAEAGASSAGVGVEFPAYIPSPSTIADYGLAETPTTIFVSREGKILRVWTGAYDGATKTAIEKYFKIRLPEA